MREFALIDFIARRFGDLPAEGFEPIGDDCTVLPLGDGEALVLTTDLLTEGIHFLRQAVAPRTLGRKALAVNLSDIAAMGARPVATLLALALPTECMGEWATEFMEGYHDLSARYGTALVGGDTTSSEGPVTIAVTAIGRAPLARIKRRSAARPGDMIFVNGRLGASGAGLRDVLAGRFDTPAARCHHEPVPQVEEGIWLGGREEVHAMMDLSDGLASDLRHILDRSGIGAQIDTERIPADADLETALTGGEDYKLLLTADAAAADRLAADYAARFGAPLYPVGRITEERELRWLRDGAPLAYDWQGYEHR